MSNEAKALVERITEAGHILKMYGGEVDHFALDAGYHNGPGCSVCFDSWCEHCDNGGPIDPCPGAEEVERQAKESRRKTYERLRAEFDPDTADLITQQSEALEKAREALEPFAAEWAENEYLAQCHWSAYRDARQALANIKGTSDDRT